MSFPSPWFVPIHRPARPKVRLYCAGHAGAGSWAFLPWSRLLPDSVELIAFLLPGRETRIRESLVTDMAALVRQLTDAFPADQSLPFALFGHSLGGLMAFELAHELTRASKCPPKHIFLSACSAPHLPRRASLHDLPRPAFREKLKSLSGTPTELLESAEFLRMFEPILLADFAVCDLYEYLPRKALDCGFTVFGGTSDEEASEADLAEWREHTTGPFRMRMFEGGHFYFQQNPQFLLDEIMTELKGLIPASEVCHGASGGGS